MTKEEARKARAEIERAIKKELQRFVGEVQSLQVANEMQSAALTVFNEYRMRNNIEGVGKPNVIIVGNQADVVWD